MPLVLPEALLDSTTLLLPERIPMPNSVPAPDANPLPFVSFHRSELLLP